MKVLLDTHALLWWLSADSALAKRARNIIAEPANTVLVSAASAWEIATKVRLGRLPTAANLVSDFIGYLKLENFEVLPISAEHAVRAGLLPGFHRDPFDRMLNSASPIGKYPDPEQRKAVRYLRRAPRVVKPSLGSAPEQPNIKMVDSCATPRASNK